MKLKNRSACLIKVFSHLFVVCILMLVGCESMHNKQDPATYDPMTQDLRHGFTIFTGPNRTVIGVNDAGSVSRGKIVYEKYCTSCHGATGAGDGDVAKNLKLKPANLSSMAKNFPNHYLVIQINQGRGDMPEWQDLLTTEQVWDLSNYIQTLKPNKR